MNLNSRWKLMDGVERSFGDRVTKITICELVDVPNHYIIRLVFRVYELLLGLI